MNIEHRTGRGVDEYLNAIKAEFDREVSSREYFQKKCAEFRRDEEISRLDRKLDNVMRLSLHVMDQAEYEADRDFRERHYEKCRNGSTFQYTLTGTGIGTIISVTCPKCGESKDITSFDNW